jgi:Flp pilus assembly protein CpaB
VHDAIALEKQGLPTVTVCTADFLAGGRMQAQSLGMPQYPILCVPQAYITHPPQEVSALAEACVDEVLKRLLVVD